MPLWTCPVCKTSKRGLQKPRLDDIVRYCFPCSEETGRLVHRHRLAQERASQKRLQKRQATARKVNLRRQQIQQRTEEQVTLQTEARFTSLGEDLRELWKRMLRLPTVPKGLAAKKPTIHVRHCRQSPRTVGWAWEDWRIQVSVWPGCTLPSVKDTMIHELAHLCCGWKFGRDGWKHDDRFHGILEDLCHDWRQLDGA